MHRAHPSPWMVVALLSLSGVAAAQTVDPNASVVQLRTDCTGVSDCFTTTAALTDWLWNGGRSVEPSAGDEVLVKAGPGDFDRFFCNGSAAPRGWVTVIGSGREHTRFVNTDDVEYASYCMGGITANACEKLNFQDLTAFGHHTGAFWVGGGSSTWSDVDMVSEGALSACGLAGFANLGWYDIGGANAGAVHYFFGSRAIARGGSTTNIAFDTTSSEVWFYGGDILAEPAVDVGMASNYAVLAASAAGMHVFGSSVRTRVGAALNTAFTSSFPLFGSGFVGVSGNGGTFHMHGGIISVLADGSAVNVTAIGVRGSGGLVHTPDTAFSVRGAGTGAAKRIVGQADSPFLWPPSATAPDVQSIQGADQFVDTDAGPSGGEAHLMVYDTTCGGAGGPWRDQTDGTCR